MSVLYTSLDCLWEFKHQLGLNSTNCYLTFVICYYSCHVVNIFRLNLEMIVYMYWKWLSKYAYMYLFFQMFTPLYIRQNSERQSLSLPTLRRQFREVTILLFCRKNYWRLSMKVRKHWFMSEYLNLFFIIPPLMVISKISVPKGSSTNTEPCGNVWRCVQSYRGDRPCKALSLSLIKRMTEWRCVLVCDISNVLIEVDVTCIHLFILIVLGMP